nr:MAG TPA: hypothetical protein [Caudoviricetes sp.]
MLCTITNISTTATNSASSNYSFSHINLSFLGKVFT